MRWPAVSVLAGALAAACTGEPPMQSISNGQISADTAALERYDEDAAYRRGVLEEALVDHDNAYSRLRLGAYTDAAWGSLPIWNPDVRLRDDAPPSRLDPDAGTWADADLVALGRRAFFEYPIQTHGSLAPFASRSVLARVPDGRDVPAFTCATCHASELDGRVVAGRNDPDLRVDGAFGPGRVDVTPDAIDDPIAIPDLRGVRWQKNLHHAATWRNGIVPLAIRIETLIITSLGSAVRPPRRIAAALAMYVFSLGESPPVAPASTSAGRAIFERTCVRCHQGPGHTGEAVPLEVIGTDPLIGRSPDRGTGRYRVPSLVHVGDRRRMFASGAIDDVEMLLDPNRAAKGHVYGLDLTEEERSALLVYLRAL